MLAQQNIDVRIVIPAYCAEATIRDAVLAVCRAAGGLGRMGLGHEIVVVDDGGNADIAGRLYGLPVTVRATVAGGSAARARNHGAKDFSGRHLVFIDADVIVASDCLSQLLAPLCRGEADASVGNYTRDISGLGFGASYKQLYVSCIYERRAGTIENDYWTAIGAVDTAAFRALGGFDGSFAGANGEDKELGCRMTASGRRMLAVPAAVGQHRHPLTIAQIFRNDWKKGVVAIRSTLRTGTSMTDNRHATTRDMLAVLLVLMITALPVLAALLGGLTPLLGVLPLAAAYMAARSDIVGCFATAGPWFLLRAVLLMGALDLLRAGCAATGIARRLLEISGRRTTDSVKSARPA